MSHWSRKLTPTSNIKTSTNQHFMFMTTKIMNLAITCAGIPYWHLGLVPLLVRLVRSRMQLPTDLYRPYIKAGWWEQKPEFSKIWVIILSTVIVKPSLHLLEFRFHRKFSKAHRSVSKGLGSLLKAVKGHSQVWKFVLVFEKVTSTSTTRIKATTAEFSFFLEAVPRQGLLSRCAH